MSRLRIYSGICTKVEDTFANLKATKLTEQEFNSIEGQLTLPKLSSTLNL